MVAADTFRRKTLTQESSSIFKSDKDSEEESPAEFLDPDNESEDLKPPVDEEREETDTSPVMPIGTEERGPKSEEFREEMPDFKPEGGDVIENENDPTPEIGLSSDITDATTEAAKDDARKSVAAIHDLSDEDNDSLSDEEVEEQLKRGHGNPEGTVVPERGSSDYNRLNS